MPEFGLGSHTYNTLFGPTSNAWDPLVSAGGSSGGAAVALALRMLPVADGSDFMGSLRNPACWNHVYGLRPSQGRVPAFPKPELWVSQLGTDGPLARNVRDLALLLQTQSGFNARAPLSLGEASAPDFVPPSDASLRGLKIGWLGDLGGHLGVEDGILPLLEQSLQACERQGAHIEPVTLGVDLQRVWNAWLVWRRALVAPAIAAVMAQPQARECIKPEALWEHDQAQGLSFADFMAASRVRGELLHALLALLERHDALALPVTQCWPFRLDMTWPREVAGRTMDTYHRWMECTLYATFAGLPAISVPAGFHANDRWPMGLQLIGRPRDEAGLLRLAAGWEKAGLGAGQRTPFAA
jgi:amidase